MSVLSPRPSPQVTVCLLTYADYPQLARRALTSLQQHCRRSDYELVVGANAVCPETLRLLRGCERAGQIDRLIVSPTNLSKCPMMRQMFAEVKTDYIWWFDDDSYITEPDALKKWLQTANSMPQSTVIWGTVACCGHPSSFADMDDAVGFVRSASWYQGLPPPSWRIGGGGQFDFEELGIGDGRWLFVLGGCWLIRTSAVKALGWPDPRLLRSGDDVFLGEAIRQQGWDLCNLSDLGVAMNTESRRGQFDPVNYREGIKNAASTLVNSQIDSGP